MFDRPIETQDDNHASARFALNPYAPIPYQDRLDSFRVSGQTTARTQRTAVRSVMQTERQNVINPHAGQYWDITGAGDMGHGPYNSAPYRDSMPYTPATDSFDADPYPAVDTSFRTPMPNDYAFCENAYDEYQQPSVNPIYSNAMNAGNAKCADRPDDSVRYAYAAYDCAADNGMLGDNGGDDNAPYAFAPCTYAANDGLPANDGEGDSSRYAYVPSSDAVYAQTLYDNSFAHPQGWIQNADEPRQSSSIDDGYASVNREDGSTFGDQPLMNSVSVDPIVPPSEALTPVKPTKCVRRLWRVAVNIIALLLMLFCTGVIIHVLCSMAGYDSELQKHQRPDGSNALPADALVALKPSGETYAPRALPTPTPPKTSVLTNSVIAVPDNEEAGRSVETEYAENRMRHILPALAEVHQEYPEVVGRIVIENVLDQYITMLNNTKYLTINYKGVSTSAGSVFVDESCSLDRPPENLLLRGRCTVAGETFAPLWQYQSGGLDFVRGATSAKLITLYEERECVLLAVIVADNDSRAEKYFNYAGYPSFRTDESMLRYVNSAREKSLYNIQVDVPNNARLMTLATISENPNSPSLVLLFMLL